MINGDDFSSILINEWYLTYFGDLQENKLLAEQATTFEQEIAYRQRKEIELENRVKDKIGTERFNNFNHLEKEDAILAGYSIWNYIGGKVGCINRLRKNKTNSLFLY